MGDKMSDFTAHVQYGDREPPRAPRGEVRQSSHPARSPLQQTTFVTISGLPSAKRRGIS